jgi:hypothetical protein
VTTSSRRTQAAVYRTLKSPAEWASKFLEQT